MLSKYFNQYQSQQDQDYNPTKKQQAIYRLQHQKKKRHGTRSNVVQDLWQQLQQQHKHNLKKIKPNQQQRQKIEPIDLARKIMSSSSIKPDKKIFFAGKQYIMNEQTGQLQISQKIKTFTGPEIQPQNKQDLQNIQIKKTRIAYQYLNHVMQAIYNRSRKINSIGKSKLDWKGFVKQQGIQHKLNYNRKGGVIKDMQFIKNTKKTK